MRSKNTWLLLVTVWALASPARGGETLDTFDRPDAADLGPGWTLVSPEMRILNQKAYNGTASDGFALLNRNVNCGDDFFLTATASTDGRPNYVSLALLVNPSGNEIVNPAANVGVFTRVIDSDGDGLFNQVEVRDGLHGNVFGSGWIVPVHEVEFAVCLHTPGRVIVSEAPGAGGPLHLDAQIPNLDFGTLAGIGLSGGASADMFYSEYIPEPSAITMMVGGLLICERRFRCGSR